MSRSGYYDDSDDPLAHGRWRAIVSSTMRSKRGQAFLKEMLVALDALPEKRLVTGALIFDGRPETPFPRLHEEVIVGADQLVDGGGNAVRVGDCCAMGAVALARGLNTADVDPEEPEEVASLFGIHDAMAREIADYNDYSGETPEQRWTRMRAWVESKVIKDAAA